MRALALLLALTGAADAVNVRVLVASAPTVRVRVPIDTSSAYQGTSPSTPTFAEWIVGVKGNRLTLSGQDSGSDSLYLPPATNSVVMIGNADYRGGVQLRAANGKVEAVNVLPIDDYLRGVVPSEMPSSWPLEALKAQAVVARTYAISRLSPRAAYDLCATEQCQVYGGLAKETPSASAAVDATRGQVVSFGNTVARTYFSSDSGGFTASASEVWGMDLPYLVAQPDPASRGPKSAWTLSLPLSNVANIAGRYGVRAGALSSVAITKASVSGRPTEITFTGANGTARLTGAEAGGFVRALGAFSTRVVFGGTDPLIVSGAGNGHGVGLSQYGAQGLANLNWNHLQILGFYFPGAAMSALQEAAGQVAPSLGEAATLPRPSPDTLAALVGQPAD
ncbi:SpoIID/LytB domain-containing protein [Deinococcus yavapaiensis]|uniref:Stage II sporulation protein D n=1 Tax=Deinococcus yavapaiensis KR-236 TaxID=694435 RepID=A0A318S6A5_9DEIO|nr:SpoIID/LytB domain-containing protein [Deinococcus yavapaiensis]PYE54203.1 stage II sporulation protein D [Deinococcus yavapaiensis KR-236]